jgi:hypothetical protein
LHQVFPEPAMTVAAIFHNGPASRVRLPLSAGRHLVSRPLGIRRALCSSVEELDVLEGAEALFAALEPVSTIARARKRHIGRDALQHIDADAAAAEALRDIHLSLL